MQILFEGRKKKSSESAEESDDKATTGGDTEEATGGGDEDTDAKDSEPEEQGENTSLHVVLSFCNTDKLSTSNNYTVGNLASGCFVCLNS